MTNLPSVDWNAVKQMIVRKSQSDGAIKIYDLVEWIKQNYQLPPSYEKNKLAMIQFLMRTPIDVGGNLYNLMLTTTHPVTTETVNYKLDGWITVTTSGLSSAIAQTSEKIGQPVQPETPKTSIPIPSSVTKLPEPQKVAEPPVVTGIIEEKILTEEELAKKILTPMEVWKNLIPTTLKDPYYPRMIHGKTDIEILKTAFKNKQNVLLEGTPGTGKTTVAKVLAYELKLPYQRVELYGGINMRELMGRYVPYIKKDGTQGITWVDGTLTLMVKYGGIFLADEINALPRDLAMKIHGLLDDDRQIVLTEHTGETIKAHDNFMFISAMNPGAEGLMELGEALRDRFHIILRYDVDTEIEDKIITDERIKKVAFKIRGMYKKEIETALSTRSLKMYDQNKKLYGQEIADDIFANKFKEEEQPVIREMLKTII